MASNRIPLACGACLLVMLAVLPAAMAASAVPDNTSPELRDKLAVGVLAPACTASALPGVLSQGTHYDMGAINWVPVPLQDARPLNTRDPAFPADGTAPYVAITSTPTRVGTNALVSGIRMTGVHTNTVGNLWVYNRSNYSAYEFTPDDGTSWAVTITNLISGKNRLGIYGRNEDGVITSDGIFVWVGERYASAPGVNITSPTNAVLSNEQTTVVIAGTNNEWVVGDIRWYNGKTWARGLAATNVTGAGDWSVAVSNLDVGRNPIYVYASNHFGDVNFDMSVVTRAEREDMADVTITNWPTRLRFDYPAAAPLSGTYANIVGSLWWKVRETGKAGFFAPGSNDSWDVWVPVNPGTNTITVSGLDAQKTRSSDEVTVIVGFDDLMDANITILTPSPTNVPFSTTSLVIKASADYMTTQSAVWTNYDTLVGGMLIDSNLFGQFSGTVHGLRVGHNEIYVHAVNHYGREARDHMTIIREQRTDLPWLAVTDRPSSVSYDTDAVTLTGTNNEHVVGTISWTNLYGNTSGTCTRSGLTWTAWINGLWMDENLVYIASSNIWGDVGHDYANITRLPNPDRPLVTVTSVVPTSLSHQTDNVPLEGTNNAFVSGTMWWVAPYSSRTGAVERVSPTNWSCTADGLLSGMNVIYIHGSNAWQEVTSDVVSTYRETGPGLPQIWITNNVPPMVGGTTNWVLLAGTNNSFLVGDSWWVNINRALTGNVTRAGDAWQTTVTTLHEGLNHIYVYGSNQVGEVTRTGITIEREWASGAPIVDITATPPDILPPGATAMQLSGTNNGSVVGFLSWTNIEAKVSGSLPVQPDGQWSIRVSGLIDGPNTVYVTGEDSAGRSSRDVAASYRQPKSATRYVSLTGEPAYPYTNWPMAARTIQQAIDAALSGETIIVAEGVYADGASITEGEQTQSRIVVDKPIRVQSATGPDRTVIVGTWDGELNAMRCARVSDGGVLDGFTLTAGRAKVFQSASDGYGGGALSIGGVITNCVVSNNVSAHAGGGVFAVDNSVIIDSRISGNICALGEGGGVLAVDTRLENCRIFANDANAGRGGGVFMVTNATLENCIVAHNTAGDQGGGIYASNNCIVTHCTIANNTSGADVGGAYAAALTTVETSILASNSGNQFGGAQIDVTSCLLPSPVAGNFTGSPMFVSAPTSDYRLQESSAAIDRLESPMLLQDIDRVPRPLDGDANGIPFADIGAHEYMNASADSDWDGLKDGWEWEMGLNPASGTGHDGASGDPDGDGLDNTGEFNADTYPNDANSVLRIIKAERATPGTVEVVVQGGINADRMLQVSDAPAFGTNIWETVSTSGAPSMVTNIMTHDMGTDTPPVFYRVRASRP